MTVNGETSLKMEGHLKIKKSAKGRMDEMLDLGKRTNNKYEMKIESVEVFDEKDQEITKLKKALDVANTVVKLSCHIRSEAEAEMVEECAREAQKQIKEIMESK